MFSYFRELIFSFFKLKIGEIITKNVLFSFRDKYYLETQMLEYVLETYVYNGKDCESISYDLVY